MQYLNIQFSIFKMLLLLIRSTFCLFGLSFNLSHTIAIEDKLQFSSKNSQYSRELDHVPIKNEEFLN